MDHQIVAESDAPDDVHQDDHAEVAIHVPAWK